MEDDEGNIKLVKHINFLGSSQNNAMKKLVPRKSRMKLLLGFNASCPYSIR